MSPILSPSVTRVSHASLRTKQYVIMQCKKRATLVIHDDNIVCDQTFKFIHVYLSKKPKMQTGSL